MATPLIKLEHVEYYYDKGKPIELHALKDINLEIAQGEYVAFFGPSGCGKSSLLYIIAGIEKPYSGKVLVNGKNLAEFSEKELAEYRQTGVGIVFQNFNLIPSMTVMENVGMPLAFLGVPISERNIRARSILKKFGIDEFANRYPFELSGGQQQRVGIARAMANDPPLMLADEPLGNLDSDNAKAVLEYLGDLHNKQGMAVIMVTHESWSLKGAEKIFHMKDGEVVKTEKQVPATFVGKRPEEAKKGLGDNVSMPKSQDQANAYSAYIMHGYPKEEVERLENFMTLFIDGKSTEEEFLKSVNMPYKIGGVGIWKPRARKITDSVVEFITQSKRLEGIYKKILHDAKADISPELYALHSWLLGDTEMHEDRKRLEALDHVIGERIKGMIPPLQFVHVLNLSANYGGVGVRINTAMKLGQKLETLLGEKEILSSLPTDIPKAVV